MIYLSYIFVFFFFQAEDGIRDVAVTGVQTCALPISAGGRRDAGLHLSPLHVPRSGPAPHEFPPAALDPANVGVRVRGLRARDGGVSGSDRRGVPVLFIWGCDGGHVNAEVRTRNAERKGEHLFRVPTSGFRVDVG